VSLMGIIIVKFSQAIAKVLKRIKVWAGGGVTFGVGITAPFVASLPASRSGAPTALYQGGCDRWVVSPQASHRASAAFTMAAAVSWVPAPKGRKADQKHGKEKIIVR
jgi:hypothetical protein